jgi:hypothetical protein
MAVLPLPLATCEAFLSLDDRAGNHRSSGGRTYHKVVVRLVPIHSTSPQAAGAGGCTEAFL